MADEPKDETHAIVFWYEIAAPPWGGSRIFPVSARDIKTVSEGGRVREGVANEVRYDGRWHPVLIQEVQEETNLRKLLMELHGEDSGKRLKRGWRQAEELGLTEAVSADRLDVTLSSASYQNGHNDSLPNPDPAAPMTDHAMPSDEVTGNSAGHMSDGHPQPTLSEVTLQQLSKFKRATEASMEAVCVSVLLLMEENTRLTKFGVSTSPPTANVSENATQTDVISEDTSDDRVAVLQRQLQEHSVTAMKERDQIRWICRIHLEKLQKEAKGYVAEIEDLKEQLKTASDALLKSRTTASYVAPVDEKVVKMETSTSMDLIDVSEDESNREPFPEDFSSNFSQAIQGQHNEQVARNPERETRFSRTPLVTRDIPVQRDQTMRLYHDGIRKRPANDDDDHRQVRPAGVKRVLLADPVVLSYSPHKGPTRPPVRGGAYNRSREGGSCDRPLQNGGRSWTTSSSDQPRRNNHNGVRHQAVRGRDGGGWGYSRPGMEYR